MSMCEYCNDNVHHECDRVIDEYDMCYHVWCYERIQEQNEEGL
jgi:hypothetical protein